MAHVVTLAGNQHRSANHIEELRAVEGLIQIVGSPKRVAAEMSIPLKTIQRMLRLGKMVPVMREAFDAGKISITVAEQVARLTPAQQEALYADGYDETRTKWKVTTDDVRRIRMREVQDIAAALPAQMFEGPKREDIKPAVVSVPRSDLAVLYESALRIKGLEDTPENVEVMERLKEILDS